MYRNKFYALLIVTAVICASFFFYLNYKGISQTPLNIIKNKTVSQSDSLFPAPDKTRYQMQLYMDIKTRTLYGSTLLTTRNDSGRDLSELWFTVYPNSFRSQQDTPAPPEAYYAGFDEGWLQFDTFKINGSNTEISGQGACLRAKPTAKILDGQDIKVEMTWKVRIPRVKYRFGSKDTVYMLGNFYPVLNVLGADGWHNAYNAGFGDPFCFNTANYLVTLNIPTGYNFVSTGNTVDGQAEDDGRETYLIRAENARDFCLLVMYDYTEIEEKIKGTTIKCYFPGLDNEASAAEILKKSGRILDYYNRQFGSYPYNELKVIFVPMQGFHGMEYSGMVFMQEELLQPGMNKDSEFILAHEIAHQWWYGMVGNDQLREPWLDEGLANWSAYQYLHDIEGQPLPVQKNSSTATNLNRQLSQMNSREDYYSTAYRGGEAFWFGLEKRIGHDAVIKVLRHYLADYRNKIANTHDLMSIIKTEAHQNMDDYIYKWFPPD